MKTLGFARKTGLVAVIMAMSFAGSGVAKEGFSDSVVTLKDGLKVMLQDKGATSLKKTTITPSAAQIAAVQSKCGVDGAGTYTLYQGSGGFNGSVMQIDQKGKEGPLQLLVGIGPDGKVYDAAFTVFGEKRGKPALSWNYLKQYVGKDEKSQLELGKDIQQVAKATYTSKSVLVAIKRAVCVYAEAAPK